MLYDNSYKKNNVYNIFIILFVTYLLASLTRLFNLGIKQDIFQECEFNGIDIFTIITGDIVLVISVVHIFISRYKLKPLLKTLMPLLFLFLWMLISTIWSYDPFTTIKRFTKVFVYITFVISVFLSQNPIKNLKKTLYLFSWIGGGLSLLLIIFFKEYGWMNYNEGYLPCGIFIHKNALALFAASMLITLSAISVFQRESLNKTSVIYKSLFIILVLEVILTEAMDVILGVLISIPILTYLYVLNKFEKKKLVVLVSFLILFTFFLIYLIFRYFISFNHLFTDILLFIGKDPTFTGRTDIWGILLSIGIKTHPFLGSGFGVFFISLENLGLIKTLSWVAYHAHNTYLQVYLEMGIVGVALLIYLLLYGLIKLIFLWKENSLLASILLSLFTLCTVQTLFEIVIINTCTISLIFPCLLCIADYKQLNINRVV
jgi:exopolysaccharide production protein ExoQ